MDILSVSCSYRVRATKSFVGVAADAVPTRGTAVEISRVDSLIDFLAPSYVRASRW
jgi:hypothetical protein